jgi:hypothetical protein
VDHSRDSDSLRMTTFPHMLSGRHVEQAVIETCVKWSEEFIAETERQFGIPAHSVPVPTEGQYTSTSQTFEKWPEEETPAVLVLAPGLVGKPRREADRSLTAPVAVGLGFLVGTGHGSAANRELAQFYAAAYSELMLRIPLILQGIPLGVESVEYLDERYNDIPGNRERMLAAARLVFSVGVKNWRSLKGGPPEPDPRPNPYVDPPAEWPTVLTVFRTLNEETRRIDG